MDQITLLPDFVLVEIFGNLSPRMIKCCALVCKRWDEIIGTSMELMGRFKLDLFKPYNKIHEAKELQRKHQTAMVRIIQDSWDMISRHNLQSLEIRCNYTKLSTLINVLNNLSSLKVFDALYCKITNDLPETSDSLKKVRNNLIDLSCNLEIIHIFNCCTVKKLTTIWENPVSDSNKKLVIEFLMQQRNLEDFTLFGKLSIEFFTLPDIFEFKFFLKKFDYSCKSVPLPHYEPFIKFLNQQKKALTNLELDFCTEPQFGIEFIHKFALENIVNLKHLEIGFFESEFDFYLGDEITYNELPAATNITRNLESLKVRARSTDMNENRRFYDMFPNLKYLDLDGTDGDDIGLLHCISERCVNVERLVLLTLDDESQISSPIYFPKLKEFSVDGYYSEENLCAFINRHSRTLEKIIIEDIDYVTHLTAKEILNCPNLNSLSLGFSRPKFSFMGMLDEISSKTKPFTLDFVGHKFKFPDDKAIWDEEIEKMENNLNKHCCAVQ